MQKINYINYETPSDYLKIKEGMTIIKILSDGFIARKHGLKTTRWIPLGECKGQGCDQCAKGNLPKISYIWIVLDRTSKKVRMLDAGKLLGDGLSKFAKDNGDPQTYDIQITRQGNDKNTKYSFEKLQSKDLDAQEINAISINKQYLISKYLI
jgi:hypothetical protein